MKESLAWIKDFWNLPEGKQFISGCFVVISALSTVVGIQYREAGKQAQAIVVMVQSIADIRRENGIEQLKLQQRCDSEKTAMNASEIAELKAKIAEKEAVIDQALRNVATVENTQARVQKNLKNTIKAVAK